MVMNATSVALAMASTSRAVFASSPPVDGADFFCAFAPPLPAMTGQQGMPKPPGRLLVIVFGHLGPP
jgi:hypothetical protein